MAVKLGLDCKAYYGTAGSTAATELTNCKDVTLNLEKGEADVTTRGSTWRLTVGTLKDASVDFTMLWDDTDAGFIAIKDAFFNSTNIALAFLDGAAGEGLDADFSILKFTRNEPLEEAVTVDISVKPTYSTRYPAWI